MSRDDALKKIDLADLPAAVERVRTAYEEGTAACIERRERVLRHPDLAARLTQPPLDYARPDQWNGYVPPATIGSGDAEILRDVRGYPNRKGRLTVRVTRNDSPRRIALVEICAEAWQRDQRL